MIAPGEQRGRAIWIYIAALALLACLAFLFYEAKTRRVPSTPPTSSALHDSKIGLDTSLNGSKAKQYGPTRHLRILKEVRMESTISTEDLNAKLDRKDPVTVVETLAPERYREAHIPGALNIPPEQIKELAPQLLPNKDAEIVTYCANTH